MKSQGWIENLLIPYAQDCQRIFQDILPRFAADDDVSSFISQIDQHGVHIQNKLLVALQRVARNALLWKVRCTLSSFHLLCFLIDQVNSGIA